MARYFLLQAFSSLSEDVVSEHLELIIQKQSETIYSLQSIAGVEKATGCGSQMKDKNHMMAYEIVCHYATLNEYQRLEEKLRGRGFDVWLTKEDDILKTIRLALTQRLRELGEMEEFPKEPHRDSDDGSCGNDG
ncbi:MAG: hypothetical protein A2633_02820 [Candidatus Sungbacteria bacterium RIFCSPHIGHO2_01_FULL_47_32]|uniref:Uncharacterized protein n=1 Tax=Candidatus Sungbacteria bacterium RIFCSPHIGHO2_01_FULL_47_32 TaxID=1802264 RepID=A0A1G2K4I9_9BACT|nr:MAG: hypothetical protein UX72_C0030G0027 [Parcubacteria group bacterium GW2011_GWA2_47_10]OGZ94326.1 MAG: hypothetical protein A2633_02820 [Candidatus Sungbacteria bacterium RIFCSPHIGHO2_01_FULL_47_32]OGZ99672.1 MAG: hypothetical protein A3D57_04300 [Candidatus Sungbacteria bacterium RIFCSPHIGHO2_02_FULL_46_12]